MICYLKNKTTCESYYVRGRHSNVDCFYLVQNYFKLPAKQQTIRENTNFICLFPQDLKTLTTFSIIMWEVTRLRKNSDNYVRRLGKKQHGFVIIDLSSKEHNGKYRSGLDEFYIQN